MFHAYSDAVFTTLHCGNEIIIDAKIKAGLVDLSQRDQLRQRVADLKNEEPIFF